jgi:hypothetical protein
MRGLKFAPPTGRPMTVLDPAGATDPSARTFSASNGRVDSRFRVVLGMYLPRKNQMESRQDEGFAGLRFWTRLGEGSWMRAASDRGACCQPARSVPQLRTAHAVWPRDTDTVRCGDSRSPLNLGLPVGPRGRRHTVLNVMTPRKKLVLSLLSPEAFSHTETPR